MTRAATQQPGNPPRALRCMRGCALQILESVIKVRWAALPQEQREGIKNYTSNLIIKYSTSEQLYRGETTFINKLNLILVQILKQVRCCGVLSVGGVWGPWWLAACCVHACTAPPRSTRALPVAR
jgi:hypothetical protein